MLIKLAGTTFCVSGNFHNFQNTRTIEAKLKAKGGKTSKSMGVKTQALVAGHGYVPKRQTAKDRGLPILTEANLKTLLADGEVEIDFTPPGQEEGEANLDDLLGEVRGVLGESPSRMGWLKLVRLLDQCRPEQADEITSYVESHISRWSRREQMFCDSPQQWQVNMANGIESPLYQLVRRLDLNKAKLNTTNVKKMLSLDTLVNVRHMDLAVDKKLTKTLFRALAKDDKFNGVEHLSLGFIEAAFADELDEGGELKSITQLGLYPSDYWRVEEEDYRALFASETMKHVKRLVLHSRHGWGTGTADPLALLEDTSLLPSFDHLEIDFASFGNCTNNPITPRAVLWTTDWQHNSRVTATAAARIKTLTITTNLIGYVSNEGPFKLDALNALETVRFYGVAGLFPKDEDEMMKHIESVFVVADMEIPDSLKRVVTNVPIDRGPFAEFAAKHPDIELVHDPLPEPLIAD